MNMLQEKKGNMYQGVKTWNPFVGCLHECTYCKPSFQWTVQRVYHCQGKKCEGCRTFEPHVHPERLEAIPTGNVIWPCAHGDIAFAPPDFIRKVIARTKRCTQRAFYWQSKDPSCLAQYLPDFPKGNTILLTTLETNRDIGYEKVSKAPVPSRRYEAFRNLNWDRKILTIEPIQDFDPEIFLEWIMSINPEAVWIGYNSKRKQVSLNEPGLQKALEFIGRIRESGIEVWEKHIPAQGGAL